MNSQEEHLAAKAMEAKSYEEAVRLLQPLAEKNSEYALLSLGWIYENGVMGAPDKGAARVYYERAAANGSASAYLYLGWLLLGIGEEAQARSAFEGGVQLNSDECRSALKKLFDRDIEQLAVQAIEAKEYEEAVHLLQPLLERNSTYALITLGWIYETGATGKTDKDVAREYYERAATNGSAPAYFELGRLLLGRGEELEARSALEAGAERGDIPSMSKLGKMMIDGRGGPTNIESGTAWLEKAAAQGHIIAKRTLLGIEEREAKSLFEKLSIRRKIASLAKKGAIEMLKDPQSDKVR